MYESTEQRGQEIEEEGNSVSGAAVTTTIRGSLPAVTRWAAGRGGVGVSVTGDSVEPSQWL